MNEHENPRSDLSRLYRDAVRPEPSQALDEAILAAARDAAGGRPQGAQKSRSTRRWSVPFALAATVLLTVSVTLMVHDEQQVGDASLAVPATVPARPEAESATESANSSATGSATRSAKSRPETQAETQRVEPLAKPAYLPTPAERRNAAVAGAGVVTAPAPAPAQTSADLPSSTSSFARERADKMAQPAHQPAPAAQGALATDATAPGGSIKAEMAASAPAPAVATPRALEKSRAFSSSIRQEAEAGNSASDEKSPERWIVEIRALKRIGRTPAAEAMLIEFRKRFPDYKLPDDLK